MPVAGCGQALNAAPQTLLAEGFGIALSGGFQNPPTRITDDSAGSWFPYTPALVNFTIGSGGSNKGFALFDGFTLDVRIEIKFGVGATLGATEWGIELPTQAGSPVNQTRTQGHACMGDWSVFDASAALVYQGGVFFGPPLTTGMLRMRVQDDISAGATTSGMKQGLPINFDVQDELVVIARLEIDSFVGD